MSGEQKEKRALGTKGWLSIGGRLRSAVRGLCAMALLLLASAGCDTAVSAEELFVIEAFLETGQPLAPVAVRVAEPLNGIREDTSRAIRDADVTLTLDGQRFGYRWADGGPERYVAEQADVEAEPHSVFRLEVQWQGQYATAEDTLPPPVGLDSVDVSVPEEPVEAVLLDSLGTGGEKAVIYPVEVRLWWTPPSSGTGEHWMHARLRPQTEVATSAVDFFLRAEEVFPEEERSHDSLGRWHWRGVYAVPVEDASVPLPSHALDVYLVRSGSAYARFAATRDDPDRREPYSNVEGAPGIVAALSIDSARVHVE